MLTDGKDRARSEGRVTLLFEAGGRFVLPPVYFDWWNTTTESVQRSAVPAMEFVVSGPALAQDVLHRSSAWSTMLWWLLLVIVVAHCAYLLIRCYRAYQARYLKSEAHAFAQVKRVLKQGDAVAAHRCLLIWLRHLQPDMETRQFAWDCRDPALLDLLEDLKRCLFSSAPVAVDLPLLRHRLVKARRSNLAAGIVRHRPILPELNP